MAEINVREAWKQDLPDLKSDAIAFWKRLGVMRTPAAIEKRASELAAAAYDGDNLIGLASAQIVTIERVRRNFALWRVLVDPDYRGQDIARGQLSLMLYGDAMLHRWSLDHPEEELCGVGLVFENRDIFIHNLSRLTKQGLDTPPPVLDRATMLEGTPAYEWLKDNPMSFHGYTPEGRTLWLKWFPEVVIEIT